MDVKPSQFDLLWSQLDKAVLRHRVASQNIANVNTPGHHALEVGFEEVARSSATIHSTDERSEKAQIVEVKGGERADGNNVDIDQEIGNLTKNELMFQTFSQIIASQISTTRSAITGR